jgi:signal transduction histidine kinase
MPARDDDRSDDEAPRRWIGRGTALALLAALAAGALPLGVVWRGWSGAASSTAVAPPATPPAGTVRDAQSVSDPGRLLVLRSRDQVWHLGDHADWLVDHGGAKTIDDAQRSDGWAPVGAPRRSTGLGRGVLWLRLTVVAPDDVGRDPGWRVEFAHPRPVRLTAWLPEGAGVRTWHGGLVAPLAERAEASRSVVVPFSLPPGQARTLYFRLDTQPLGFSATVSSSAASAARARHEERVLGLYYGGVVALFLYNLFLLVALRDPTYGWYLVVVVATAQFFLSRNGYFWMAGWTEGSGTGGGALVALQQVGIANFTRSLLDTPRAWARGDRALRTFAVVAAGLLVASMLLPTTLHEAALAPLGVAVVGSSLAAGVQRARQGSVVARYYLVAWGCFLGGAVLYVVKFTGAIPHTAFTEHAMQVGSALEMVLLSLALAHRVRTLDRLVREREHGLALARVEHARAVDGLRAEAADRMIAAQDEHARRLARDLHDSVGHRFLLIERAAAGDVHDDDDVRAAIVALAREGVAETREIAHGLYPQRLLDVGLGGALRAAADAVERAGLRVVLDVDAAAGDALDPAQRLTALRVAEEALQNALRHAQATTVTVTVTARRDADAVVLAVVDDGVGRAADAVEGLGTRTMRERAAHVGGSLVVGPAAGGGTAVTLRLPRR